LEHVPRQDAVLLLFSVAAGIILAYRMGYGGFTFAIVAAGGASLVLVAAVSALYHIRPPKVRQSLKHGDAGLRLTDKPRN
jgi:hypothetical protein